MEKSKLFEGWECIEKGWWVHPKLGGVCLESDGKWWWWKVEQYKVKGEPQGALPKRRFSDPQGPYKTLLESVEAASKG